MKTLDAGNPSFEKLITSNNLYIDKTEYLYRMITSGFTYFFCSRPRRFGKTLTTSTLEALFKGKRDLFKGLYIDGTDYDWKEYPVIHIDFGFIQARTADELSVQLNEMILDIADQYGILLDESKPYNKNFAKLISELSKKEKVVILVDEYDKILTSNIYNPEIEGMRDVLRGFYEVIKASYGYVRLVFITGVTKYAKVSIFSSMNNLRDISMSEEYAAMFGYTKDELLHYFEEHIALGAFKTGTPFDGYLARIKRQYDGYRFHPDGEAVYNPVSIGMFFADGGKEFNSYWAETGGMKLLSDLSKEVDFHISDDLSEPIAKNDIKTFDILDISKGSADKTTLISLLFQTGYLTIRGAEDEFYTLGFPNGEVKYSYTSMLLKNYLGDRPKSRFGANKLLRLFSEGNTDEAMKYMKAIYASLSYTNEKKRESDYRDGFCCMMIGAGGDVISEAHTSIGRIDTALKTDEHLYIVEFKLDGTGEKALEQIKAKRYYEKYDLPDREYKIHLLGINFSTELRNIESYIEEIM